MEASQEIIFYQDPKVTVTQNRFVTDSETYAMKNILSVSNFEIVKSKNGPIIQMALGAILLIPSGLRILGGILVIIGFLWLFSIKNEYTARINTDAGEINTIVSGNRDYIQKIVDALHEAIIFREKSFL